MTATTLWGLSLTEQYVARAKRRQIEKLQRERAERERRQAQNRQRFLDADAVVQQAFWNSPEFSEAFLQRGLLAAFADLGVCRCGDPGRRIIGEFRGKRHICGRCGAEVQK